MSYVNTPNLCSNWKWSFLSESHHPPVSYPSQSPTARPHADAALARSVGFGQSQTLLRSGTGTAGPRRSPQSSLVNTASLVRSPQSRLFTSSRTRRENALPGVNVEEIFGII